MTQKEDHDIRSLTALFNSLDSENSGFITKQTLLIALEKAGIQENDPRIAETMQGFSQNDDKISLQAFCKVISCNLNLIERCLRGELIILDFADFCQDIERIYEETKKNTGGHVATYIPQLARVDPEQYAISVCTIDGQRFSLGEAEIPFCVQSVAKPINYCIALEQHGEEVVHHYIGREPSGTQFNAMTLNKFGKPHNPMVNAGGIVACSLIHPKLTLADRFDSVVKTWTELSGEVQPGFNNAVYLSEKGTADRNFALGYFMRENKVFPEGTDLIETLEFYFQCCSMEVNSKAMAVAAATLANAGICPITEKKVLKTNTVKNCLSLMSSCGMYDFSGEFSFLVGLPAKSGVSGALMLVIPGVMGISIWSPRLDEFGNSVRGIEFCKALVQQFNFHRFDSLHNKENKKDPRKKEFDIHREDVMTLFWAASRGDLNIIKHLVAQGIDINQGDYDDRTALHLAAAKGYEQVAKYLLSKGVAINSRDRWGYTPLDDAYRENNNSLIVLLEQSGGLRSSDLPA